MSGRRPPVAGRRAAGLLLLVAAVFASCQPPVAPSGSHEAIVPTPVAGVESSPPPTPGERIVGGLVVREVPATAMQPSLTAEGAHAVVAGELRAGRATMIGFCAGLPPMRVVESAFSPGVTGILNAQGGPIFGPVEPTPAWVVVLGGQGVDGEYVAVGVMDDASGTPLVVQVFTPGS